MSAPNQTLKHTATLAAGAICISFAPVFVKLALAEGMGPTIIGVWRLLFGGVMFLALTVVFGGSLLPKPSMWKWALLAGFAFAADVFVWHKSIVFIGAGMATILGNTQVFATSILGRILFKEQLSTVFKIAVPLALVGVTLLTGYGSEINFSSEYISGIIFGLLTAVFYASYIITLKSSSRTNSAQKYSKAPAPIHQTMTLLGWVSLSSAALLFGASAFDGEAPLPATSSAWLNVFLLALVAQVIGWLLIYRSLSHLPASRASLVLLLQPTFAAVWGWMFFGEELAALQLGGAALTLFAIYLGGARK